MRLNQEQQRRHDMDVKRGLALREVYALKRASMALCDMHVCAHCSNPPTPRDEGRLTMFRGEMLCSRCLLQPSPMPEGRAIRRIPTEQKIQRLKNAIAPPSIDDDEIEMIETEGVFIVPLLEDDPD